VGRILLALMLLAAAELFLLVRLGEAFGVLAVLGMLAGSAVLGYLAARAQGLAVVRKWRDAAATGAPPEEGLTDAFLVVLGGVLLALPGVISDVLGILLLIPPVRRRAAAHLRRRVEAWVSSGASRVREVRVVEVREVREAPRAGQESLAFDVRSEPPREVIEVEGYAVEERAERLLGPGAPEVPEEPKAPSERR